jgi:16S rRNA C967 or C1407 C5-methylase (RsmB/RsmF family)
LPASPAWGAHLLRYAPLVDDPDAFCEAAARPLPRVVWANPLRADPEEVEAIVLRRCPEARPVGWFPHAWRLPPEAMPGRWPEHMLGLLHGQEEAALWAAPLLGARPGERVLDLCAAPGNKTAQLAVAMGDRGTLVANERQFGRLASLRRTLDRLGITCAVVTHDDGVRFPGDPGTYDRVLVDAPCTCEGTSRKPRGRRTAGDERHRDSAVQIQKALLRRAVRLVRPGGVVVYATCTYAPEENEAVLDAVADAVVEPLTPPPGLRVAPGIAEWNGRAFRPDVVNAARLWPHQNDTGGFFVARLRRV